MRKTKRIPQEFGSKFVAEFCEHARLTVEEFLACAQLSPAISDAEIVSRPCQRWIRAWAGAIAVELGDELFDEYAAKRASRQAALDEIARLTDEVGRPPLRSYIAALALTKELQVTAENVESGRVN